jgi:GNAT superfamily N-acetyltransferase
MTIRHATVADADAIGRVHAISRRTAYESLVPRAALATITHEEQAAYWSRRLSAEAEPFVAYVDETDDEIAAFAMGSARPPTATLNAIHVLPDLQGSGTAHRLHEALLGDFAAWGCTSAELWVLEGNERAQAFYRKKGWADDGTRDSHAIGGVDVPILRYRRLLDDFPAARG